MLVVIWKLAYVFWALATDKVKVGLKASEVLLIILIVVFEVERL